MWMGRVVVRRHGTASMAALPTPAFYLEALFFTALPNTVWSIRGAFRLHYSSVGREVFRVLCPCDRRCDPSRVGLVERLTPVYLSGDVIGTGPIGTSRARPARLWKKREIQLGQAEPRSRNDGRVGTSLLRAASRNSVMFSRTRYWHARGTHYTGSHVARLVAPPRLAMWFDAVWRGADSSCDDP
jgi:hypothetical protein